MPETEPNGANSKERPRLPSVKPILALMPGIAATQIPNKRLETANKKPTANTGLFLMKEVKFLIMEDGEKEVRTYVKYLLGKSMILKIFSKQKSS